jgi:hypothetical protein
MNVNRQQVLGGLLAVVAVWAVWYFLAGEQPLMGRTPAPAAARSAGGELPEVIEIADLGSGAAAFDPSGGRNLFAYAEAKVTKAPALPPVNRRKPKPVVKTAEEIARSQKALTPAPKDVAPPRPQPPAVNFEFVGYLGPQAALIGVFRVSTPDGEEVVLAAEGEVLAENFRVHRIGYEEVEIGYTQEPFLNEKKILPMGGKS